MQESFWGIFRTPLRASAGARSHRRVIERDKGCRGARVMERDKGCHGAHAPCKLIKTRAFHSRTHPNTPLSPRIPFRRPGRKAPSRDVLKSPADLHSVQGTEKPTQGSSCWKIGCKFGLIDDWEWLGGPNQSHFREITARQKADSTKPQFRLVSIWSESDF